MVSRKESKHQPKTISVKKVKILDLLTVLDRCSWLTGVEANVVFWSFTLLETPVQLQALYTRDVFVFLYQSVYEKPKMISSL